MPTYCDLNGKIRYLDRGSAYKARTDLVRRRHGGRAGQLQVYWCGSCASYHLGNAR